MVHYWRRVCKTTFFFIWLGSQISIIVPVYLVITERRVLKKSPDTDASVHLISPGYTAKQVRICNSHTLRKHFNQLCFAITVIIEGTHVQAR